MWDIRGIWCLTESFQKHVSYMGLFFIKYEYVNYMTYMYSIDHDFFMLVELGMRVCPFLNGSFYLVKISIYLFFPLGSLQGIVFFVIWSIDHLIVIV